MEEIIEYIQYEVNQERMITRTSLLQKYQNKEQVVKALNTYYENNHSKLDTFFTALIQNGEGVESILISENQLNSKLKIKDVSIHAIALKDQIVDEELFPPTLKGLAPLQVDINEVNLSSLVQAMAVESQKVVVNKKVDNLQHKRKEEPTEFTTTTNMSKQLKTNPSTLTQQTDQNQNVSSSNIIEDDKPKPEVSKKPKIILKSRQQQPTQIIASEQQQPPIEIAEEIVIKNQPIIEEPPVNPPKQPQQSSNGVKNNSKPKTAPNSMKLDAFFKKK